ncbi:RNA/RNP complex-1-interacting phosphatase homolog isoform X1 [Teleopsis dalmanni]|uniref:RNA/RNP complex-1-interacting phosphatase homolog isoform X1 n=1 Tax=Teleopsis dalmanni TaxID=139649 RepID=UPI0018CE24CF|nr:RNA/RNP complex-1-interacting phosphatase homolog isoform X1 [Teleopsis dalmanni]
MPRRRIPERWSCYKPIGKPIEGTRFFAFKVPLAEAQNRNVEDVEKRLDCQMILNSVPNIGLVIDLTNTLRYYKPEEFLSKGVEHHKIFTEGHVVPSQKVINEFHEVVKTFLNNNSDNEKIIGVHCTHGVNRTGFLLCHYMVKNLSVKSAEAIKKFGEARGHSIERKNYIRALHELESSDVSTKYKKNVNIKSSVHEYKNVTQYRDQVNNERFNSRYGNVEGYYRHYGNFKCNNRYNQSRRNVQNQYSYQSFARRFRNNQEYNRNPYVYSNSSTYNRPQDEVFYNDDFL